MQVSVFVVLADMVRLSGVLREFEKVERLNPDLRTRLNKIVLRQSGRLAIVRV